jgi:hypothetical protein
MGSHNDIPLSTMKEPLLQRINSILLSHTQYSASHTPPNDYNLYVPANESCQASVSNTHISHFERALIFTAANNFHLHICKYYIDKNCPPPRNKNKPLTLLWTFLNPKHFVGKLFKSCLNKACTEESHELSLHLVRCSMH